MKKVYYLIGLIYNNSSKNVERIKMRKYINILGWIMVIITTIALLATLLTIYQFTYIKYFDSYYTLQWCMFLL